MGIEQRVAMKMGAKDKEEGEKKGTCWSLKIQSDAECADTRTPFSCFTRGERETPADVSALSYRFCYNMCRRVHLDAD